MEDVSGDQILAYYRSAALSRLSDEEFFVQARAVISRVDGRASSFALHAPLELLARFGLWRRLRADDRDLARLQVLASIVSARAAGGGETPTARPVAHPGPARESVRAAFAAGDGPAFAGACLAVFERFGCAGLLTAAGPPLLTTTAAASHAHIGLALLASHGLTGGPHDAAVLRPVLVRAGEEGPAWMDAARGRSQRRLRRGDVREGALRAAIWEALADPPQVPAPARGGIAGLITAAETSGKMQGLVERLPSWEGSPDAIREGLCAITRMTAQAMLQDEVGQAKFGWSHCLTLAQAAVRLAAVEGLQNVAFLAAFHRLCAYRMVLSRTRLRPDYAPPTSELVPATPLEEALLQSPDAAAGRFWHAQVEEFEEMAHLLAGAAVIREDQHHVKYTMACLDLCVFDPEARRLYLAAAAKLCGIWMQELPRSCLVERLSLRRE